MSRFAPIDMSLLPALLVVETIAFEDILDALKADLIARAPDLTYTVENLESDPLNKLLEVCAYREVLLRQRVNDAAQAVMLAKAIGSDLDHLAAFFGIERLIVQPADPDAIPPAPEILESDEALRVRTQAAPEAYSVAGPVGAYTFWAKAASPLVKTVDVTSLWPGHVRVTVMATAGDGTAGAELLATIEEALNAEEVRPLCDGVVVRSVLIQPYTIEATLIFYDGPDKTQVMEAAIAAVKAEAAAYHIPGRDVTRAGLIAALRQPGVYDVILTQPAANVVVNPFTAAWCDPATIVQTATTVAYGLHDGGTNL